ncbi:metal ABC transporter substrate-binding protein [Agrococcus sp. KRD186]|uniref:metal ABC transporter substrate-binding protein n=1 Tax=Agrococcus sp. KRD186 TaxID=2729730 RepID=UPI0019D2578E|nr:metal ABC transporter substrate-binding protein [Agrococcus sp. KRD186]
MRIKPALGALGALGAISLALTGCAGAASGAGAADDRLQIVATTTQLADVTRELVGDAAEVTSLLQPGASAHAFDPGPTALTALAGADLLVVSGAGLESWLDDTVEASGFDGTLVDTSEGLELIAAGDDPHAGHDHGAFDPHAGPDHGEFDPHAGPDHGEFDPHVWTDPANVTLQAQAIVDAVAAADPDADIDASATTYLARLAELDEWMRGSIDRVPVAERLVVTTHDTFGYLERAFDVRVVGTVLPSLDESADASAAHIDELVAEIRATGTRVVFSENAIDPQLAATIAREASVALRQGADALAADALGASGSDTGTYIDAQIHNTTAMVTAWGAEPLPVPGSLA